MANYKKLFEISIHHSFFNNERCKGLSVIPTESAKAFAHNADLSLQINDDRVVVLYNSDFTEALLAYTHEDAKLTFILNQNDTLFYAYTDLEFVQNKILYFNSSSAHEQDNILCLQQAEYVTPTDLHNITEEIYNDIIPKGHLTRTIGLVTINLQDLIRENAFPEIAPQYAIKFNVRQTYWRYNIIQRNSKDFDHLIVKDNHHIIEFTGNNSIKLSNGDSATQIISTQPIEQVQSPTHFFDLIGVKNNQETILIKQLETPDIKNITKENDKRISELYIYC